MLKKHLSLVLVTAGMFLVSCQQQGTTKQVDKLETDKQKVSYGLGMDMGGSLKKMEYEVDFDALVQGLKDTLQGGKVKMTTEEFHKVMMAWSKEQRELQRKKQEELAASNLKKGQDFLAKNKTAEGVKTTESGLQYKITQEGTGAAPADTDVVEVVYEGRTIDGEVFDSSKKLGKPARIPLMRVVPGWREGIKLLKEGGKATLYIPSNLAYGPRGPSPKIGPNATLIFDIELVKVNPDPEVSAAFKPSLPNAQAGVPGAKPAPAAKPAADPHAGHNH